MKSGRALVLTCSLLEGSAVKFSWFKDGRLLRPGDTVNIIPTEISSMLQISGVTIEQTGSYACLGSDGISEERATKHITVEGIQRDFC